MALLLTKGKKYTVAEAREVLHQLEEAVSAFDALSSGNGSVRAAMEEEAIGA